MGQKLGGCCTCPFGGGGAGSPSNTMWPGQRPACQVSSWSLPFFVHNTSALQTGQTDRTGRLDRQTDRQTGQRSDSIKRIVLQTVAQ